MNGDNRRNLVHRFHEKGFAAEQIAHAHSLEVRSIRQILEDLSPERIHAAATLMR